MTRNELLGHYRKLGKNVMTPRVLAKRVLVSRGTIVELAQGKNMDGGPLYGVSILAFDETGERNSQAENSNPHLGCYRCLNTAERHFREA